MCTVQRYSFYEGWVHWVGVKFSGNKRYVTLQWPLINHVATTVTDEVDTDIDPFPSLFRFLLNINPKQIYAFNMF